MSTAFPQLVVATITDAIGAIERGAKYEDPLADALDATQLGELRGSGTQLDAAHQIAHVELELGLADLDGAIALTRTTLHRLGAPVGSVLRYTRDAKPFTIDIATGATAEATRAGANTSAHPPRGAQGATSAAPVSYDPAVIRDSAAKILAKYRSLLVEAHQLGPIFRDAYAADVFTWYDDTTATLQSLGFTALGDLKVVKDASTPEPGAGPFARRFLSGDHTHRIEIFQLAHADAVTWSRVMNITTELSDGTFLWTTTSPQHWNIPDHVALDYLTAETSPADLFAIHKARLAKYFTSRPAVSPVLMATLSDVLSSENRCQAKSAAFRKRQGAPSVEELRRMGSNATLAPLIHAEMHRTVFGTATEKEIGLPA